MMLNFFYFYFLLLLFIVTLINLKRGFFIIQTVRRFDNVTDETIAGQGVGDLPVPIGGDSHVFPCRKSLCECHLLHCKLLPSGNFFRSCTCRAVGSAACCAVPTLGALTEKSSSWIAWYGWRSSMTTSMHSWAFTL